MEQSKIEKLAGVFLEEMTPVNPHKDIFDITALMQISQNVEDRNLVIVRLKEIFLIVLPNISDMAELVYIWDNVSPSPEEKERIKSRMAEVLSDISDIMELVQLFNNAYPGSDDRRLILARISEVLPNALLDIFDMVELMQLHGNIPFDFKLEHLIEVRMSEVLSNISGMIELVQLREIHFGFDSRKICAVIELIETRMIEVVSEIKKNNISGWFISMLEKESDIFDFLLPAVMKKARELVA